MTLINFYNFILGHIYEDDTARKCERNAGRLPTYTVCTNRIGCANQYLLSLQCALHSYPLCVSIDVQGMETFLCK